MWTFHVRLSLSLRMLTCVRRFLIFPQCVFSNNLGFSTVCGSPGGFRKPWEAKRKRISITRHALAVQWERRPKFKRRKNRSLILNFTIGSLGTQGSRKSRQTRSNLSGADNRCVCLSARICLSVYLSLTMTVSDSPRSN